MQGERSGASWLKPDVVILCTLECALSLIYIYNNSQIKRSTDNALKPPSNLVHLEKHIQKGLSSEKARYFHSCCGWESIVRARRGAFIETAGLTDKTMELHWCSLMGGRNVRHINLNYFWLKLFDISHLLSRAVFHHFYILGYIYAHREKKNH